MRRSRGPAALVFALITLCSCAPSPGAPAASGSAGQAQPQPARTLVVVTRAEPPSLAGRAIRSLGLTQDLSRRMFNSYLTIRNDAGAPVPYLAEAVPQLN